jgi:hypothetical protein
MIIHSNTVNKLLKQIVPKIVLCYKIIGKNPRTTFLAYKPLVVTVLSEISAPN